MKILQINNLTGKKINKTKLEKILKLIFQKEKSAEKNLSLAVVKNSEIRKINKIYRGKDKPTNVLSFSFKDDKWPGEKDNLDFLGEIIISIEQIEKDAKKNKCLVQDEFEKVFVHGAYHLLGYDHEKEKDAEIMEKKEEQILEIIKNV